MEFDGVLMEVRWSFDGFVMELMEFGWSAHHV